MFQNPTTKSGLQTLATKSEKIVFAFEFMLSIETDLCDVRMNKVITERRVINTRLSINQDV